MFRKFLCVVFVMFFVSGVLVAQRGKAKDLAGEFFAEEAFNRPLKIIAGSYAPQIIFTRDPGYDCTPEMMGTSCFVIDDPDVVQNVNQKAITKVVIPARSLHDVLLINARNMYWAYYRTDLLSPSPTLYLHQPSITIRSSAPGVPPLTQSAGHRRLAGFLTPEASATLPSDEGMFEKSTRITRSLLRDGQGWTPAQIDAFFDSEITIELNLQVKVQNIDSSQSIFDLMIYGY